MNDELIRVAIVSGVCVLREGLASLLARQSRFDVVASVDATSAAVARLAASQADVALVDAGSSENAALARQIVEQTPSVRVVALAVSYSDPEVRAWAEAGVAAYVARDAPVQTVFDALDSLVRGKVYAAPEFVETLMRLAVGAASVQTSERLTAREREILALIDAGLSNKRIARQLLIQEATVKNHVHNILEKLHARDRHEAVQRVRRSAV